MYAALSQIKQEDCRFLKIVDSLILLFSSYSSEKIKKKILDISEKLKNQIK